MKKTLKSAILLVLGSTIFSVVLIDQLSPALSFLKKWGPGNAINPTFERIYNFAGVPKDIPFDQRKIPAKKRSESWQGIPSTDKDYSHQWECAGGLYTEGIHNVNTVCPIHLKRISNGATLFRGVYSIDQLGRRVTIPVQKKGSRVFALDGCSFTFGDTVRDDETISSRLQHYRPDIRSLNLGVSGRGPNSSVFFGEATHWRGLADAREASGYVAYLFVDFQVSRVMEDSAWMQIDRPHDPVYRMEKGKAVFQGFAQDYYSGIRGFLFSLYTHSKFFETFRIEAPLYSLDQKMDLTASLIHQDLDLMAAQIKSAKKLLLIHPFSLLYGDALKRRFEGSDVQILDYSKYDFYNLLNGHIFTPEGHPSPLVNDLLAALIAHDLKKLD